MLIQRQGHPLCRENHASMLYGIVKFLSIYHNANLLWQQPSYANRNQLVAYDCKYLSILFCGAGVFAGTGTVWESG